MNNVILQNGDNAPFMQGRTTLKDTETILYHGKKSISVYCTCGKPFAESIMENGIVIDSVICSRCEKEMAHIVERENPEQ